MTAREVTSRSFAMSQLVCLLVNLIVSTTSEPVTTCHNSLRTDKLKPLKSTETARTLAQTLIHFVGNSPQKAARSMRDISLCDVTLLTSFDSSKRITYRNHVCLSKIWHQVIAEGSSHAGCLHLVKMSEWHASVGNVMDHFDVPFFSISPNQPTT